MEQTIDRRVRKTKKLLLDALSNLMTKKKINKITVKELTDMADVNRATFYLYYKDIFDMLEQIETDMFNDFSKAWEKYIKELSNYDAELSFFTYIFEFVGSKSDIIKILLGPDGDYNFIKKFLRIIEKDLPPVDSENKKINIQYFSSFMSSGCIGVIQKWLENGMKTPPKEMGALVLEVIKTSCSIIEKENK